MTIGLTHFLLLAAALFCIGLFGLITSRNVIRVLMCIEIMLNAVNINFVAFARFDDLGTLKGQVFALFVMVILAAEAGVALALIMALYRNRATVDVDDLTTLKG